MNTPSEVDVRKSVWIAVLAVAVSIAAVAQPANAAVASFCTSGITANTRCISAGRNWLYGVGTYMGDIGPSGAYLCVGAKTNSDGSGGNALPFRCDPVAIGQEIWTAGGNSNYGWATVINDNPFYVGAAGLKNYR